MHRSGDVRTALLLAFGPPCCPFALVFGDSRFFLFIANDACLVSFDLV